MFTNFLLSLLAILVIAVVMATVIVFSGIDPESVESWRIWSFTLIVGASISTYLMTREKSVTLAA